MMSFEGGFFEEIGKGGERQRPDAGMIEVG